MVKLSEKDKKTLISIFEPSKYSISTKYDINQDNYNDFIQFYADEVEKEDYGISKAVFFPTAFPNVVVKIPFTAGPEEEYWYSNGSYSTADMTGKTVHRTYYSCEMCSDRFDSAWESIPDNIGVELNDDWNYCEVEEILFNEAIKYGVDKFFAQTICIGYIEDYPIYVQERGRVYDQRDERPLLEEEKIIGQREFNEKYDAETAAHFYQELVDIYEEYCKQNKLYCHKYSLKDLPDKWAVDFYLYWGIENLHKLLNFLDEYCIDDLHCENVGYINHIPVIIDYSSFHS